MFYELSYIYKPSVIPKIFMITIVHTRYYPTTSGISQVYPKILL